MWIINEIRGLILEVFFSDRATDSRIALSLPKKVPPRFTGSMSAHLKQGGRTSGAHIIKIIILRRQINLFGRLATLDALLYLHVNLFERQLPPSLLVCFLFGSGRSKLNLHLPGKHIL